MWCAARFGLGYEKHVGVCRVAVNFGGERKDADFFLEQCGHVFFFQLVTVSEPDRRIGDEQKAFASGEKRAWLVDPEIGGRKGPQWIAQAVAEKVGKHYAGSDDLHLLIYGNFFGTRLEHEALLDAVEPYREEFGSIWMHSSDALCTLVPSPKLGSIMGWGTIF